MNQAIYDGFKTKLQEMFMTDRADLDFGIYRVMNLKRKEIQNFLEKRLLKDVEKTLNDNIPSGSNMSVDDMENIIFSHLTTFFSRYYDEGDFISARRYGKDDAYVIPYKGEEVKLHWANADQYYIKTTEDFRDYQFLLADEKVIHFVLKDAQVDRNNNIPDKNSARRFRLWTEGDSVEPISETETNIYFTYELESSKNKQNSINEQSLEVLKSQLKLNDEDWEVLEKHLTKYTNSNSFDYFIHKDLGGFLKRELDIYIKNEVLNLSNLNPTDLANQIAEINAMKEVGEKIIDFLAQIENFQKKLWLKKKFVIQSDYCITLDYIIDICEEDDDEELLKIIASNNIQIEEWKHLFKIDEIKDSNDHNAFSEPVSVEFLKENPYLIVDTQFYDFSFKAKILNSLYKIGYKIDEKTNGILISSENFQALNLLQNKYANSIKCTYIDPPYNAKSSKILYKNTFEHSSWLSLMENRISLSRKLLTQDSVYEIAIDEVENARLCMLNDALLDFYTGRSDVSIVINPSGQQGKNFSTSNEYVHFYFQDEPNMLAKEIRSEETADIRGFMNGAKGESGNYLRSSGKTCFYPIFVKDNKVVGFGDVCDDDYHPESANIQNGDVLEIYPIDAEGIERKWLFGRDTVSEIINELSVKTNKNTGLLEIIRTKTSINFKTVWTNSLFSAKEYGTNLLTKMFGSTVFSFPKSIHAVKECIGIAIRNKPDSYVLDFFAGSGTTGHAVINLNREDNGNRKYILVEMGNYFNTVTKPRVLKAAYSSTWKNGSPVDRDGVSQIIKYFRLEQYEDTLDNLQVTNEAQQLIIDNIEGSFSESYKINNMLDNEFTKSILNLNMFEHPFDNSIKATMYNESKNTKIDMVDTFNYLIGIKVNHIEYCEEFDYKLCIVDGYVKEKHVLVIWRDLAIVDNNELNRFLNGNAYNVRGGEYDNIYVNGGNNIQNMATDDDHFKVELIEEVFMNKMFEA